MNRKPYTSLAGAARAHKRRTARQSWRRPRRKLRRERGRRAGGERAAQRAMQTYLQGFHNGMLHGRELLLQAHLPQDLLIPDLTPDEAMAAGVSALRARGLRLLSPREVAELLNGAVRTGSAFAFIRLGDGELLTLAQDHVMTLQEIRKAGSFLPRSGVTLPNPAARDALLQAVSSANLIGVPMSRLPHFQPLLLRIVKTYGINLAARPLTTSTMNCALHEHGYLLPLLRGRRVLLIGNTTPQLVPVLQLHGLEIVGVIAPVRGFADVQRVIHAASCIAFDFAWVSAGIAAVPICTHLAEATGRPAFDMGSLADRMIESPTHAAEPGV